MPLGQRNLAFLAQKVSAQDAEVKVDVMANEVGHLRSRLQKDVEHLVKRTAVFYGIFGGDMMHRFDVDGYLKALGLNDIVVVFHKTTFVVMNLPCQLHHAWPIVEVGQWRVIILG